MSNKQLVTVASEEQLALLKSEFPAETGFQRVFLPKLGMFSQDKTEGKGKSMKVITEAGTFYLEREDGTDNDGKKVFTRTEIGLETDAIIIYQRKKLQYYDESTDTYTVSSIYDNDDEVIPLWCNKAEIAKDTPKNLKDRPEYKFEKDGKVKSKLEDVRILYVLHEGELFEMTLRGSSMYSWLTYSRAVKPTPAAVLTHISSEPKEKGTISWNQMTFTKVKDLDSKEIEVVIEKVSEIKEAIKVEKEFFAQRSSDSKELTLDEI